MKSISLTSGTSLAAKIPLAISKAVLLTVCSLNAHAQSDPSPQGATVQVLQEIVVSSTRVDVQGIADSASEGRVTKRQLSTRPLLRAGDLMETVPGLVATQHAGEGKANQYFLRGFNLDHGTDFATYVDGVPINLPTHGHGQGYTDLYFVIPELVDSISFRKGPYYVQEGDFSAVGSARLKTIRRLAAPIGIIEAGQFGYARVMAAGSFKLGTGDLLIGAQTSKDDGPWQVKQNLRKTNLTARFSQGNDSNGWSIGANHYEARWISTDQIPERLVNAGSGHSNLGRFTSLDPSTGGNTKRTSVYADWANNSGGAQRKVNVWATQYDFDLFSNFTYFTRGCDSEPLPITCFGPDALDQFEQVDKRKSFGFSASQSMPFKLANQPITLTLGVDFRQDNIAEVALYDTQARIRLNTVRNDSVKIGAASLWTQLETQVTDKLRLVSGVRWDHRRFDVDSTVDANSGIHTAAIISPKTSLVYSPNNKSDLYLNWGRGFHSNDARGAVIKVDPRDATSPVPPANALVKATGYEIGGRQKWSSTLSTTASIWHLNLDSELVFVGDAGSTAAAGASQRRGVEVTGNWRPSRQWEIDADVSFSRARFKGTSDYVPGAMERVASVGATYANGPWTVGSRLRYFGSRALVEDNSLRAASSTLVNLRTGYRINKSTELALEIFNLFNLKTNDIEYAYASRLPFESSFSDANTPNTKHFHPALPRTIRLGLKVGF
jgi:outer membrane receptor protein involved in Fe transport